MLYDSAIRVCGISKQFNVARIDPYKALHEKLEGFFRRPFQRPSMEPFWALRDVSFEVKRGEVFGIVGGNGAGKSVLLRILSRILKPTGGYAEIRGRASSIIQLGAAVHPELTGRANIYQCGAILRLRKGVIDRNFDEIVAFAELEEFLDRPIKTYSTGMQMRLAFAIMSQLDTEILLIDEALSVGDEAFRQKCLERMRGLLNAGRTVVIVSHDSDFIRTFCDRVVVLHRGRVQALGAPADVMPVLHESLVGDGHR
jgi:lipopolysaccharide transport system ATP-binding protein